jgi:hypothetical protein
VKPGRLLLVLALALVAWPAPARAAATDPIAHHPTLIKEGAYYYDVITGDSATRTYLPLRRSRDLVHCQQFRLEPAGHVLILGTRPRRRAAQWSLTPRNDDTYMLGNRAGGEHRVKIVMPGPGR